MRWVGGEDCGHHGNNTALFVSVTVTPCALCWAGVKVDIFMLAVLTCMCITTSPHRLGRPGVELSGFHDEVARVLHILPVVDEPAFVTVCSGNQLYRWRYFSAEEGSSSLVLEKTYKLTGGP